MKRFNLLSYGFLHVKSVLRGGNVTNANDLFEAAEIALPVFCDLVLDCLDPILQSFQGEIKFEPGKLKERDRALEKARDDYAENYGCLLDIVRGRVICETEEQINEVVRIFIKSERLEVVRLKNRFATPMASRFRDFNIVVRVKISDFAHHFCELQVHLKAIVDFDEVSKMHFVYQYFRTYFAGSIKTVASRIELFNKINHLRHQREEEEKADAKVAGSTESKPSELFWFNEIIKDARDAKDKVQLEGLFELLKQVGEYTMCEDIAHSLLLLAEESSYKLDLYDAISNVGLILQLQGRNGDAKGYRERCLAIANREWGEESMMSARAHGDLGTVLQKISQFMGSLVHHEQCLKITKSLCGDLHIATAFPLNNLGALLQDMGRLDEALGFLMKCLEIFEKEAGEDSNSTASSCFNIGMLFIKKGLRREALIYFERCFSIRRRVLGAGHVSTIKVKMVMMSQEAKEESKENKEAVGVPLPLISIDNDERYHTLKASGTVFETPVKYSLIRPIGAGAYGVVISALDSSTNQKVAIKKIKRAFDDKIDAKRILREIKLMKKFVHENVSKSSSRNVLELLS